jgi:hypothetical protein
VTAIFGLFVIASRRKRSGKSPVGTSIRRGARHALVWGDPLRAARIAIHESQWDAGTQVDKLALDPFTSRDWAIISRCCTSGAKTLDEVEIGLGALINIFPQNDEASTRWLETVIAVLGRDVFVVSTPTKHKDLNDWGRNGLTPEHLWTCIQNAELREPKPKEKPADKDEPDTNWPETLEKAVLCGPQLGQVVLPPRGENHKGLV